jgi:NitT/TauT family transport system ATP-binding protein
MQTQILGEGATAAMPAPPRLSVSHVAKTYGSGPTAKEVIGDLTFDVAAGEFLSIVGPSGVGKTTLLKVLAGLLPATSGQVLLDGNAIAGPPREMALIFQDYTRSLMPWFTVAKNVALPLHGQGLARREIRDRVRESLEQVGLDNAAGKYPWQLSGGMQQRVAIARGLAYRPEILLMDEPFASLDAQTRFELEDLLLRLKHDLGITTVFVTHDIDEAVYLSDRIVVLGSVPCRVHEIVDVPLGQDRTQLATRAHRTFAELRTRIMQHIQMHAIRH